MKNSERFVVTPQWVEDQQTRNNSNNSSSMGSSVSRATTKAHFE